MDYTFTFTPAETQVIMRGLGKLLLEDAAAAFGHLCMQKEAQDKATAGGSAQPPGEHSQSLRMVGSP